MHNGKAIVVVICKNEGKYIKEFVDYHLNLGFDQIVIGDNNDVDGEKYDSVLKEHIDNGRVVIVDLRGKQGFQKIFYNTLDNYGIQYEWAAFIDTDEFITFSDAGKKIFGNNIKKFLGSRNYVNAYKLNWRIYGDNEEIEYREGNVVDRFPNPLDENVRFHYDFPENYHCKSILRYDVKVNFTDNPHGINNLTSYFSPAGVPIPGGPFNTDIEYSILYIRHYYTKSLQEWCENKLGRSYADYLRSDRIEYYPLKDYFIYNTLTADKVKWIREHKYEFAQ